MNDDLVDETTSEGLISFTVEDFPNLQIGALSPAIMVRLLPWKIGVMPVMLLTNQSEEKTLGFFLNCNGKSTDPSWNCKAKVELKVVNQTNSDDSIKRKISHTFHCKSNDCIGWGFSNFMSWNDICDPEKGFLNIDGSATFQAKFNAYAPRGTNYDSKRDPLVRQNIKEDVEYPGVFARLADQFSDLNINPESSNDQFTDAILCIDKDRIHCSKMILALSSNFFKRMFASGMKEATSKEVPLKEIDLETLKSLLNYMYTDKIKDEKINVQLLAAADMYEVMRLRSICSKKLSKIISLQNVAEIWINAYLHNVDNLADCAISFMASNWKALSKNKDIQDLGIQHPQMLLKIFTLLADCQ